MAADDDAPIASAVITDADSSLESSPQDSALYEIYHYVVQSRSISAETMAVSHVIEALHEEGIWFWRDCRFRESQNVALAMANKKRGKYSVKVSFEDQKAASETHIGYSEFEKLVSPCAFLYYRAFSEELVIPDWMTFTTDMTHHFFTVEIIKNGKNADYIPILKNADSEKWGLSMCSTDGQRFSLGDVDVKHTLQSTSKPVTYALCLQREGSEYMHQWIGVEPAGRPFNTQDLDDETHRPYNSSVNSGAIMAAGIFSSVYPKNIWMEIVDKVRETWYDLSGNDLEIGFSKRTFESEKATAYNNFAIAYNLKGRRGLPRDVDLLKMLDVYLGCCSIEITTEALAVAAATLANGGVCPITSKEVFPAQCVRHVLSETMTCGMYDQSGLFAVDVGLPAKSGVSGALMVIVPNVLGFATFSPRLNERGNSVRGVEFCKRLVGSHRVHTFEPLRSGSGGAKIDPRTNGLTFERDNMDLLAWALKVGDVNANRLSDIFLFALCRVASSSHVGLTDKSIGLIRNNFRRAFLSPVNEDHLQEIISAVRRHPSTLQFLEELIGGFSIPDEMRSITLVAMADVLTIDCSIEEMETSVATKVAVLLGFDEEVAELRVGQITARCGHRFKDVTPLDQRLSALRIRQSSTGLDMLGQSHCESGEQEQSGASMYLAENHHLRKEVYRLNVKIDELTRLLHKRDQNT